MAVRGERFHVDLSSDEDEVDQRVRRQDQDSSLADSSTGDFIKDILERPASATPRAPTAPQLKASTTGFPLHKKRTRPSASGQNSLEGARQNAPVGQRTHESGNKDVTSLGRCQIDGENRQRLEQMSDQEKSEEREALLAGLSQSTIERLTRRANIDQGRADTGVEPPQMQAPLHAVPTVPASQPTSSPSSFDPDPDPDRPPLYPPPDLTSVSSTTLPPAPQSKVHFPSAPGPPDLDPSSSTFLTDLHTHYFPNLPSSPSKLAWLAPPPPSSTSPYNPLLPSLPPSALRFSFTGTLLPPRTALTIPATAGLHHHGDAPEAAGYTIPELARLARSAFAAQRCVAFQTLGRILYRLGKGEWGAEGDDLVMGLWRCVDEGGVVESLTEAAGGEGGHVSARAYAVEALWNWRKGGGRRFRAQ
ncbi:MAG: hypothetical protein M1833_005058 [Piccolia ochrophora]|nr:MAG: hypothetical protein M1833_005058 [Piccolia ochrophora]